MEKKTIGSFIATLRKANGLTQKELSEKLNVSDKSISRWERDETAPDLTLIPVIAEIFDVTSDELLTGERNKSNDTKAVKATQKKDEQIKYILNKSKTNFTIKSFIAIGLVLLSIIICSFPAYSYEFAQLKPMLCTCTIIVALILEIIIFISSYSTVNVDKFDSKEINEFKVYLINVLKTMFFVSIFALLIISSDIHMALLWMLPLLIYAYYISFIINMLIDWIIKRKNFLILSDKERKKNKIYIKISLIFLLIMFVLWLMLIGVNILFSI